MYDITDVLFELKLENLATFGADRLYRLHYVWFIHLSKELRPKIFINQLDMYGPHKMCEYNIQ